MGIGMGALIAGLFGMNASFDFSRVFCTLLTVLALAYEPHGRTPVRLCRHVCRFRTYRPSRCVDGASKVRSSPID